MQRAFLSLILTAAHISVMVDCRPRHQRPQLQHKMGGFRPAAHAEMSAGAGRFSSEDNGSVRNGFHTGRPVVLPTLDAPDTSGSVSDVRRKGFLCIGELYKSRQRGRKDCLFQHIWLQLANQHVFYSTSGNQLMELGGGDLRLLLERLLHPRRQKRSEVVNPADPLKSESHPVKDNDQSQPEQEQTGAVSKETISSCDDPLRVLRSNGPGSPVKTNIADQAEQ
ncbi:fibroblast growth factor 23 [Nothobranchius furzeri]|uniref:LOC107389325-like protein n=4 Tax=Nothobranchius TaxID=28779 RepID=A0A1A8AWT1_NOTFU|nr:uncharacterized protein LOC107389325 [Nothobranchius furzeri]KAF7225223.1 putative LOC107389325-like protein [Nothobranchius furzeri]